VGAATISAALVLFLISYLVSGMAGSALNEQARERSLKLAGQERVLREKILEIRAEVSEWTAEENLNAVAAEAGMSRPGAKESDDGEEEA
jgi:type II secretory pathway component PulK